jgi:DNA-binding transcriptional regulator YiaG
MNASKHEPHTPQLGLDLPVSSRSSFSDPSEPPRIRDLLQRAGLSQREAARKFGLHERTVRYWCEENGKIRPPKMAIVALERLAELRRRVSPKD